MPAANQPVPRIGVPYRLRKEEVMGDRNLPVYLRAVEAAGAVAVPISLQLAPDELAALAATLDGIVLSGSPADVDPRLFEAEKHRETNDSDPDRERTDFALIEHALKEQKPLLAICYGIQSLNVFLGGTLIQDIPAEVGVRVEHDWDEAKATPEAFHAANIQPQSRLGQIAGRAEVQINSSHHQSVREVGRDLRAVAWAPDGVVEAVEWSGPDGANHWLVGVQWHPERMTETDPLAQRLFADLVGAANARRLALRG